MNIEFASGYRVPPYFLKNAQTIKHITDTNISKSSILNMPCQCEVSLRPDGEKDWWVLPIEPVVNITGKNIIIKRNILAQVKNSVAFTTRLTKDCDDTI